jgi:hypothetical protein
MPKGPFGAIAKQMMKEDPKKADAKKDDAKAEPKKADAKAEAKKDDKKADAQDPTMPPKVKVTMDDAVIAGLPANTGPTSLSKKPVAKVVAQTAAKETPAKADAKAEPKKTDKMDDAVIAGIPAWHDMAKKPATSAKAVA